MRFDPDFNDQHHYLVKFKDFEDTCSQFRVQFSFEETNKLKDLFLEQNKMFNFKKMSVYLGLHKDSFSFINTSRTAGRTASRVRNYL